MQRVTRLVLGIVVAMAAPGCGLLLDYDPPDVDAGTLTGMDGGARDASVGDGALDGAVDDGAALDARLDAMLDDGAIDDGGVLDGTIGADAGPCAAVPDGSDCSGASGVRLVCIAGACVVSRCGDGVVDTSAGEACDPLFDVDCDPRTCRYECASDTDCPAPSGCLVGACVLHHCEYVADHGGGGCSTPDGHTGVCRLGVCVTPGCGNGIVELGEDCDNGTATVLGCTACHFDCHTDADCSDGDACNGLERCDAVVAGGGSIVGRSCATAPSVICGPAPACFTSLGCQTIMDAATCVSTRDDADGDLFSPEPSCPDGNGGDCNDADPSVFPGAPEVCNAADDDCDGVIDEDTSVVTWCRDADGDGFGDPNVTMTSCAPPGPPFVRDCSDCFDSPDPTLRPRAALVHPGQTAFFTTSYCPPARPCSFDYDCDGAQTEEVPGVVSCGVLSPLLCATSAGWQGSVPACGVSGTYATCQPVTLGLLCRSMSATRTQACR